MARDKSVYVALDRLMSEVSREENEILFKCMSKAMKKCKADVKASSPTDQGDYSKGWAVRTKRLKYGFQGVIYNRDYPGLTHLLEKGHVGRNQFGTYGRVPAKKHIEPAREAAEEYLVDLLEEAHA